MQGGANEQGDWRGAEEGEEEYYGEEEEYWEEGEEDDGDEDEQLLPRALPVEGEPNFDAVRRDIKSVKGIAVVSLSLRRVLIASLCLNRQGPPMDGIEYLRRVRCDSRDPALAHGAANQLCRRRRRRHFLAFSKLAPPMSVRWEAARCPDVVCSKIDPKAFERRGDYTGMLGRVSGCQFSRLLLCCRAETQPTLTQARKLARLRAHHGALRCLGGVRVSHFSSLLTHCAHAHRCTVFTPAPAASKPGSSLPQPTSSRNPQPAHGRAHASQIETLSLAYRSRCHSDSHSVLFQISQLTVVLLGVRCYSVRPSAAGRPVDAGLPPPVFLPPIGALSGKIRIINMTYNLASTPRQENSTVRV